MWGYATTRAGRHDRYHEHSVLFKHALGLFFWGGVHLARLGTWVRLVRDAGKCQPASGKNKGLLAAETDPGLFA